MHRVPKTPIAMARLLGSGKIKRTLIAIVMAWLLGGGKILHSNKIKKSNKIRAKSKAKNRTQ